MKRTQQEEDTIRLYELSVANQSERNYSIWMQFQELKQTYPDLTQAHHAAIIRDYLREIISKHK